MAVHNDRVTFHWPEGSCEDLYQKIEDGNLCVAQLRQVDAFELIQWVIRNKPASEFLLELRQYHFTLAQEQSIRQLEKKYETPMSRAHLPYRGDSPSPPPSDINFENVRRRLFFDDEEEEEMKPDCSVLKFVLVLAGSYVIYRVVVKPIFKQIGEYFQKDVGVKP